MIALFLLLYVAACLMVGLLGRDAALGTFGTTLASLLLTPVLSLLLLLMFRPNRRLREALARERLGPPDP